MNTNYENFITSVIDQAVSGLENNPKETIKTWDDYFQLIFRKIFHCENTINVKVKVKDKNSETYKTKTYTIKYEYFKNVVKTNQNNFKNYENEMNVLATKSIKEFKEILSIQKKLLKLEKKLEGFKQNPVDTYKRIDVSKRIITERQQKEYLDELKKNLTRQDNSKV